MVKRTNNEQSPPLKKSLRQSASEIAIRVALIGGVKGGTGKSTCCHALIDKLLGMGRHVILIETDTGNPDVGACYVQLNKDGTQTPIPGIEVLPMEMGTREGFTAVIRAIEKRKYEEAYVVINSRAGNINEFQQYGAFVVALVEQLGADAIRTMWVINPFRDSLLSLKKFVESVPTMPVDVIMPKCWGEERHYKLFNESEIKPKLEKIGGKCLMFPVVQPDQMIGLFVDRQNIEAQSKSADFIGQVEIQTLRSEVDAFFTALTEG